MTTTRSGLMYPLSRASALPSFSSAVGCVCQRINMKLGRAARTNSSRQRWPRDRNKKKDGGSTTRKDSLSSNHRAVIEQTKQVMNNMLHEFFFMLLCCVRIGVVPTPKRRRSSDHCVLRAPGLLLDSANCSLMKEGPASVAFLIKTRQNEGGGWCVGE